MAALARSPSARAQSPSGAPGFRAVAESINATIRARHYRPAELDSEAYRRIEQEVLALGRSATTADEFLTGFNMLWRRGPFSHVRLWRADVPASVRLERVDTTPAGDGAVALAWHGREAVLTVNTMSGPDTIERIEAAYRDISVGRPERLIIDLRANDGGAFAVVPLVGHLIARPVVAGVFATRRWYEAHANAPGPADFATAVPWRGYSVRAFVPDMLSRPLTGYQIDPLRPRFRGPVFVLISGRSVSAAEIAADVLKATSRAILIGEKTPGALLSSSRFDVEGGFQLMVPIADYYSIANGRIEGVGVSPDVAVPADQALSVALAQRLR